MACHKRCSPIGSESPGGKAVGLSLAIAARPCQPLSGRILQRIQGCIRPEYGPQPFGHSGIHGRIQGLLRMHSFSTMERWDTNRVERPSAPSGGECLGGLRVALWERGGPACRCGRCWRGSRVAGASHMPSPNGPARRDGPGPSASFPGAPVKRGVRSGRAHSRPLRRVWWGVSGRGHSRLLPGALGALSSGGGARGVGPRAPS